MKFAFTFNTFFICLLHTDDICDEQLSSWREKKSLVSLLVSKLLYNKSTANLQLDLTLQSPLRTFAHASMSVLLSLTPDAVVSIRCAPHMTASFEPSRRQLSAQLAAMAIKLSASSVSAQSTLKHTGRKVYKSTFNHSERDYAAADITISMPMPIVGKSTFPSIL